MQKNISPKVKDIDFHDTYETQQILPCASALSSRSLTWSGFVLDYYNHPAHEVPEHYTQQHIIAIALNEGVTLHDRIETQSLSSRLQRGDMIICPAGFQRWCAWEEQAEFLVLSIDQSTLAEALYQRGDTRPLELVPQLRTRDHTIEYLAMMLMNEIRSHQSRDPLCIDSLLHLLYFHLLRHYTTANPADTVMPSHPSKRKLRRAIDYIQAHLASELDILTIAGLLEISSYELTLLFVDLTGLTPYQYLMRCRIERAKALLVDRHISIQNTALQVGFASVHQFNTQFLQLVGVTPNVYQVEFAP